MISLELGVEDLAKYPFLEKTGEYIRQRGLSLEDFSQPDLSKVIGRAKKRILQARSWSREVSVELDYPDVEILSFPLALMLVKATKLDHLISCYSLAEAVRVEKLLESEREELVVQIFRNVLKIDLSPVSERKEVFPLLNYKVTVMEYLKRATHFHQLEWKLVNRVVDQGYVYLRTHELIRLIRQEIDDMIRERLKDLAVPRLPENLEKTVRDIAMLSPPPMKMSDRIKVSPDKYPPCVKTSLSMLQKGENLPHYGRFLLTTYLANTGSSVDEIMSLYPRSPDFNERITRYQVEHIAGLRGGRVKYKCPSCRTLITHSFCFKTKACDDIKNPLQFGRQRLPSEKSRGKKGWTKRPRRS